MEPLTIALAIAGFIGAAATAYVIYCACIRIKEEVLHFFAGSKRRREILQRTRENPDFAYVTYMNEVKKGNLSMYSAILNRETQEVVDAREFISGQMEAELARAHMKSPLIMHQFN